MPVIAVVSDPPIYVTPFPAIETSAFPFSPYKDTIPFPVVVISAVPDDPDTEIAPFPAASMVSFSPTSICTLTAPFPVLVRSKSLTEKPETTLTIPFPVVLTAFNASDGTLIITTLLSPEEVYASF